MTLHTPVFLAAVGDFDTIWREHCEDEQTLNEYAFAMKSLADNHWAKKCDGEGRIEWCRRYNMDTFTVLCKSKDDLKNKCAEFITNFMSTSLRIQQGAGDFCTVPYLRQLKDSLL